MCKKIISLSRSHAECMGGDDIYERCLLDVLSSMFPNFATLICQYME